MKLFFKAGFLIILSTAICACNVYSQSTNSSIWYFGQNAGIDFNSGSPVALTNGMISTYEGCATICDNSGAILFYTDGITVYNSNHGVMQNGTSLNGNSSSNQSAIIVPFPADPDLFYIFTTTDVCTGPFAYSVVDMSLAGGLGAVTVKNNILVASATEKLTAVKAANGTDYWVVVHQSNNNLFSAFHVTATGISAPVVSTVGSNVTGTDCAGGMKLNPQGTKLAVVLEAGYSCELFDFNNVTGVISNSRLLGPMSSYTYSCEFSPGGQYLYLVVDPPGASANIFQFDVTLGSAAAINASSVLIGSGSSSFYFGSIQNGPDGKIYVAREGEDFLGVINAPDLQGVNCNYVDLGVNLSGRINTLGLPNYVTSWFVTTGIEDVSAGIFISLFPNPLTTHSTLSFSNPHQQKFRLNIYDIAGKLTESYVTAGNEIIIDKDTKQSGVYLFDLINEKSSKHTNGKIVVSN